MALIVQRAVVAEVHCEQVKPGQPGGVCINYAKHVVHKHLTDTLSGAKARAARHFRNEGWQINPIVLCPSCLKKKNIEARQQTEALRAATTPDEIKARTAHFMRIKASAPQIVKVIEQFPSTGVNFRGSTKGGMAEAYATRATYARASGTPAITEEIVEELIKLYGQREE